MASLLFWGCDNDPGTETDFEIDYTNDDGTDQMCSATTYKASFSGTVPAGGQYYWLEMAGRHGDSLYLPAGAYQNRQLEMSISDNDNVPDGLYFLKVYGSNAAADVGNLSKAPVALDVGPVNLNLSAKAEVDSCCTGGHFYASAIIDTSGAIAVKAKIKTRIGKLCGEDNSFTDTALTAAWVNISLDQTHWAQVGYDKYRAFGDTVGTSRYYYELNTGGYHIDPVGTPMDGQWHTYMCSLDVAFGDWYFYRDGVLINVLVGPFWINKSGYFAQWSGEIYGKETDMPGTSMDKCTIQACSLMVIGGTFNSADFSLSHPNYQIGSSSLSEWGIELGNDSEIRIWDKDPLP